MPLDNVCLDVWAGQHSQEHVARYLLNLNEALLLAKTELHNGFLVNLRQEAVWGQTDNFDTRIQP